MPNKNGLRRFVFDTVFDSVVGLFAVRQRLYSSLPFIFTVTENSRLFSGFQQQNQTQGTYGISLPLRH
jgi:hypothetical protein